MIGAGGDDVAGLERVDGAHPFDDARDVVRHVGGIELLHHGTVVGQRDAEVLRIGDLVGGHDARAYRRKGVARLHLEEDVAWRRQAAGRAVDEAGVPEDVSEGVGRRDARRALADDQRHLSLALEDRGRRVGQHHRVAVADHRGRRLVEGVDRRLLRQRAVFHVVHRHADDVAGLRHRRTQPHARHGHALAVGGGLLDLGLVGVPLGDEADHQVTRIEMRDVLHGIRHVDNLVALDDTQPVVIEIAKLHFFSPSSSTFLATLAADIAVGQPE